MNLSFHIRNTGTRPSNAVLQGLAILESFYGDEPRQTLAAISRRLDLPKASALRHLSALEDAGYVVRDQHRRYSLSAKVLQLARAYLQHNELLPSAQPVLDDLAAETGETAHLGVLDGTYIVYAAIAESPQRVRACVMQGDRIPAHCVASGKAILAHAPASTVDAVTTDGLEALTPNTIVSTEAFMRDLEATRDRGYALNVGEWTEEVIAASAPVFAHTEEVIAAIGIAGPKVRILPDRVVPLGEIVRKHADRLSSRLGASAETPEMQALP